MRSARISILLQMAVIASMTTTALSADSVETFVSYGEGPGNPFDFYFSDFNPSLGTLDSMNWSLAGGQTVLIYIPNCDGFNPVTPLNYTYTITGGFDLLGSSVGNTQSGSGTVGNTCGGFQTPAVQESISGSGTVSDPTPFIGTEGQFVEVTGFASGVVSVDGGFSVQPVMDAVEGNGTLTVTYDYTPTPEPRMPFLILIGCGLVALARRKLSWVG